MRIQPTQKRNFDESRTLLARSSAECCNPKGLQNGAKSFELSNISRHQNFGAIKVTRQNAPKIPDLKLMNSDEMADAVMLDESAMRFILLLSKKFVNELKVGKDEKGISWNIMSDFSSFTEQEMVKRLSNVFKLKNLKLNIESVSNQSAEESAKNFAKEISSK